MAKLNYIRISIYVPQDKQKLKPLERLYKLAQKQERSLNFMIIQAVTQYVEREERKAKRGHHKQHH